jgi:hypothetical protein
MMSTDTPRQRGGLVAAGAGAHRWFKLGSDHLIGPRVKVWCGWRGGFAVAGEVAEVAERPFFVFPTSFSFSLRLSATSAE